MIDQPINFVKRNFARNILGFTQH